MLEFIPLKIDNLQSDQFAQIVGHASNAAVRNLETGQVGKPRHCARQCAKPVLGNQEIREGLAVADGRRHQLHPVSLERKLSQISHVIKDIWHLDDVVERKIEVEEKVELCQIRRQLPGYVFSTTSRGRKGKAREMLTSNLIEIFVTFC